MSEAPVKERSTYTISLVIGFGSFNFTIDPTDQHGTAEVLNQVLRLAQAPLLAEIQSLKKRVLSADEIQQFANLVKAHPREMRLDGRPTADDRLVERLEEMLKD
jgi:hypothetical protein